MPPEKASTPKRQNIRVEQDSAGILRRLGALFYDAFLIIPLWMLITLIFIVPFGGAPQQWILQIFLFPLLLLTTLSFYSWFWMHGGQTLGMRAWRLKIVTKENTPMPLSAAILRCVLGGPTIALFGIAYLWIFVDKDKLALHDRFSKTRIIVLEKNKL